MAATNFDTVSGLESAVADWLNRKDLTDAIPGFIRLAEVRIRRDVRPRGAVVRDNRAMLLDFEALPSDFLEPIAAYFNLESSTMPLEFTSALRVAELRRNSAAGLPSAAAVVGNQLWFDRTPQGQILELSYYAPLLSLYAIGGVTNDLLQTAPDLYLYGALAASAPYLKDDPRLQTWDTLYRDAVNQYRIQEQRQKVGPSPVVVRSRRNIGGC